MRGFAPSPRQGRSSLDPSSGCCLRQLQTACRRRLDTMIAQGHGGYGRQPELPALVHYRFNTLAARTPVAFPFSRAIWPPTIT